MKPANKQNIQYPISFATQERVIECPECLTIQMGKVEQTFPWPTFIHDCVFCKYIIMESEWNEVKIPPCKPYKRVNQH